jgi:hypothetical protein
VLPESLVESTSSNGLVGSLKGNVTISGDAGIGGTAIELIRSTLLTGLKLFPFCFPVLALRNIVSITHQGVCQCLLH